MPVHQFFLRFESRWGQNCYVVIERDEFKKITCTKKLQMNYVDKDLWLLCFEIPEESLSYTYVVVDDFDPDKVLNWEPRNERLLRKGEMKDIDIWGKPSEYRMESYPFSLKWFHIVDAEYEIFNGLLGMMRDILIHLCNMFAKQTNSVRAIIGMCKEQLQVKNHPHFINCRKLCPSNIPIAFIPNERGFYTIYDGKTCVFCSHTRSVFIDLLVKKGIYKLVINALFPHSGYIFAHVSVGVAKPDYIHKYDRDVIGSVYTGLAGLSGTTRWDTFPCGGCSLCQSWDWSYLIGDDYKARNTQKPYMSCMISMEANADDRTAVFTRNEERLPRGIAKIPVPFYIGVSGRDRVIITFVSLQRMPIASAPLDSYWFYKSHQIYSTSY